MDRQRPRYARTSDQGQLGEPGSRVQWQVILPDDGDLDPFRDAARRLIAAGALPETVSFASAEAGDLLGQEPPGSAAPLAVPPSFVPVAELVVCHAERERFALLYTLLWRMLHGERKLLDVAADPLVHRLHMMTKAVRRDLHKMTAFVRFRRVLDEDGAEAFIAWFEPEHFILRRAARFFTNRFAAMRWSILTPKGGIHWDGQACSFTPAETRERAPREDELEDWWRTYYRSIFNPARAKPDAMRAEMPKKYWRNLPEAALIEDLLRGSGRRTQTMIEAEPVVPKKARPAARAEAPPGGAEALEPGSRLAEVAREAKSCTRCPLYAPATQTVFGEGPEDAPVVFVGEQPGDQEDLAGKPFVGPAGQMFNRALAEAGVDRSRVYVTNAVKHFKFIPRGKRRIHQKPDTAEIVPCRWWLDQELDLVRPRLTVALGATAARALCGRTVTIGRERGRVIDFREHLPGLITVHPSYLLRIPDQQAAGDEYRRFVEELALVGQQVPEVRR